MIGCRTPPSWFLCTPELHKGWQAAFHAVWYQKNRNCNLREMRSSYVVKKASNLIYGTWERRQEQRLHSKLTAGRASKMLVKVAHLQRSASYGNPEAEKPLNQGRTIRCVKLEKSVPYLTTTVLRHPSGFTPAFYYSPGPLLFFLVKWTLML